MLTRSLLCLLAFLSCLTRLLFNLQAVWVIALEQGLYDAETIGRLLDPGRRRDVDDTVTAPTVLLQKRIEVSEPFCRRGRLFQRRIDVRRRCVGDDLVNCRAARVVGELPHHAVGFHRLSFISLQEFREYRPARCRVGTGRRNRRPSGPWPTSSR